MGIWHCGRNCFIDRGDEKERCFLSAVGFNETIRFALQVLGSLLLIPSVAMNKDNFIES